MFLSFSGPKNPRVISQTRKIVQAITQGSSRRAVLVIGLVATLAMAPELATGLTVTDNFRFNLSWPEQFTELFRSGHLYPRWLPQCWDGMGSPVFYFYPPLFFWVTSLADTMTAGTLASERLVPFASLILLVASGVSMRSWLRLHVGEQRALVGAIAYLLGPYHLYDLYGRGALAEASAYASVPLIMWALARLGEGRPVFTPILAVAFAALLFSHLLIALLVSLFLIAPYVAFVALRSAQPIKFIMRALAGGLLGLALAAIFILPALALLPRVSPSALTGSFYRPENWFFWNVQGGSGRMLLMVPISIAAFLFAIAGTIAIQPPKSSREPRFWAALTMFLVILVAGLVPPVWELPGLVFVQFPWRALMLIEFTTVTFLVIAPPSPTSPFALAGAAVLGFAYLVLGLIAGHMVGRTWSHGQRTAAEIRADRLGPPEYLPAGTRIHLSKGPDVHVDLPDLPLASADEPRARIAAAETSDGQMTVTVDSPEPTRVALRRLYFPHWRLYDSAGHGIPIAADPDRHVVSFRVPKGKSLVRLESGTAPYEVLGRALSLLALFAIAAMVAVNARFRE